MLGLAVMREGTDLWRGAIPLGSRTLAVAAMATRCQWVSVS